ncbi:MAG: thermonuclease family protein [Candidatus Euphemobacter frigidus]|nr:thermonuclease family protein [Candidatus Euphemobacter frigidus]MDP8276342.1 thermonuclease family protein [Candidatus Euphemobacter frigidus]
MAQLISIRQLNPDRVPVTIKARVISLRPSPRELVAREGRLEDETGIIQFTLWTSSGIKDLEKGQQYIFHRAGLGKLEGELRIQLEESSWAYPVNEETDTYRIMIKIAQQEQAERRRLMKGAKITRADWSRPKRTKFSIAIAAGFVIWGLVMVLVFTDLITEEKIRHFFQGRRASRRAETARKAATVSREGEVKEVLEGGIITVKVGEELWTIHYLGLDVPRLPSRKGGPIDPLALQALNFNKFLARNKTVRLEFEEWLPPEDGEARAYVFDGEKMLNIALLERGLARLRKEAGELSYSERLSRAEESARSARKGIWRKSALAK